MSNAIFIQFKDIYVLNMSKSFQDGAARHLCHNLFSISSNIILLFCLCLFNANVLLLLNIVLFPLFVVLFLKGTQD